MDIVVSMYVAYLAICLPVVLFVGWTLRRVVPRGGCADLDGASAASAEHGRQRTLT
jgi:hypothetical protein